MLLIENTWTALPVALASRVKLSRYRKATVFVLGKFPRDARILPGLLNDKALRLPNDLPYILPARGRFRMLLPYLGRLDVEVFFTLAILLVNETKGFATPL